MSFFNLRIGGRLYVGFGALVLFCAALAGFGVWQLGGIYDQVGLLAFQSRSAIRVGEIATELQAIRRELLRYTFDQDEASFAESDKRLSKVMELLEEFARTTNLAERRLTYKAASNAAAELKTKRAALGDVMKQMLAGRNLLFADGDKMAADVQKLVDATDQSSFADDAKAIESKVLLVRIANWRMLATRDAKGLATFKANVGKAQQQDCRAWRKPICRRISRRCWRSVKADVGKYAESFEKTGPNLVLGDELYYKSITPLIADTTEKMDRSKSCDRAGISTKTSAETDGRITSTITMQEMVAGAAVLARPADRFPYRSRNHRPAVRPHFGHERNSPAVISAWFFPGSSARTKSATWRRRSRLSRSRLRKRPAMKRKQGSSRIRSPRSSARPT